MTDYSEEFENVDSGASATIPSEAGEIKKGSLMVFDGRPCKVVDYSTAKTGKHGHAKASITGIDIFTGKKYEDSVPCSHNVEIPIVNRTQWTVSYIDEDGYLSLINENGQMKNDLRLPDDTDNDVEMSKQLRADVDDGKTMNVTVIASMGIEKIADPKEDLKA